MVNSDDIFSDRTEIQKWQQGRLEELKKEGAGCAVPGIWTQGRVTITITSNLIISRVRKSVILASIVVSSLDYV